MGRPRMWMKAHAILQAEDVTSRVIFAKLEKEKRDLVARNPLRATCRLRFFFFFFPFSPRNRGAKFENECNRSSSLVLSLSLSLVAWYREGP